MIILTPLGHRRWALYLNFLYCTAATNLGIAAEDLSSGITSNGINNTILDYEENSSTLAGKWPKLNITHINSSNANSRKINKTVTDDLLLNNIISEVTENTSLLATKGPSMDIIHINSSYESTMNEMFSGKNTPFLEHSTEENALLQNFNGSQDSLRTTESFLHLDPKIKHNSRKENSSRKLSENKFLHSNFTQVFNSINHSIANTDENYLYMSTKKLENETFISVTDHPVNMTKPESYFTDYEIRFDSEFSTVEASSSRYIKDDINVMANETNELTTGYEPQSSLSTFINETKNEPQMLEPLATDMKVDPIDLTSIVERYVPLDDNALYQITTQNYVPLMGFNITSSHNATESLRVHSPVETSRTHKTEITTNYPFNINTTKHMKLTQKIITNVSAESVMDITDLGYNYSGVSVVTESARKLTSVLPYETSTQYRTPEGLSTKHEVLPEFIKTLVLNYTECNNNLCLDKHRTSELPNENYTVMHSITDTDDEQSASVKSKNITEIHDIETVPATASESITRKGSVQQRSQKTFLMIPWKSLTAENLQDRCVTVEFKKVVSSNQWLSSYDIEFREFLSRILNKTKTTSNIMYISPTPVSIDGELLVAFVVETKVDGDEMYESGSNILYQLNKHREKLQLMMDTEINNIQIGFPETLKKDLYCKTNNENASENISLRYIALIACLTITIVTVLVTGIYLAVHRRWTATFSPEQHSTEDNANLTDPESQSGRYTVQDSTNNEADANNEAYQLNIITKLLASSNYPPIQYQERKSTSHNSVCTLDEE